MKLSQGNCKKGLFLSNCIKTEKQKHFKVNYFQNNSFVKDALNQKANISCFPNNLIAPKNQKSKLENNFGFSSLHLMILLRKVKKTFPVILFVFPFKFNDDLVPNN
jgi:hypothetical protein